MAGAAVATLSDPHAERVRARERLIVALDVDTADEAIQIVRQLDDAISYYKIGLYLQLDPGLHRLIELLIREKKHIFLDFKAFDIPATISGAVRAASRLGIDFVTVVGQRPIVEAAVKAKSGCLKILVVTLLTGMTQDDMRNEYHTDMHIQDFIAQRANFAAQIGCDGVISSAQEIEIIREAVNNRPEFLIVTPGIRPRGVSHDDQKRVTTPLQAIKNGANYLVVGRPIIRSDDRVVAARDILEEMEQGLSAEHRVYA